MHPKPTETTPFDPALRAEFLGVPFDLVGPSVVENALASRSQSDDFAYVVTPNVDHVVRLARTPEHLTAYHSAWMSWCDSRPLLALARLHGIRLAQITGADATVRILSNIVKPGDRLLFITADDGILTELRARIPTCDVVGISPPPGFDSDPRAFAACVDFIIHNPARFTFIGVGSPRSEALALAVLDSGRARGTAFCIGAALEFVVGRKRRAPAWMRRLGIEWLHRLTSEPGRLWRRYVGAVVPLMFLFIRETLTRRSAAG